MCQMEVTHDTKLFHLTAPHLHIVDVGVSVVGTSVALGGVRVLAVVAVIVCKCQQKETNESVNTLTCLLALE